MPVLRADALQSSIPNQILCNRNYICIARLQSRFKFLLGTPSSLTDELLPNFIWMKKRTDIANQMAKVVKLIYMRTTKEISGYSLQNRPVVLAD